VAVFCLLCIIPGWQYLDCTCSCMSMACLLGTGVDKCGPNKSYLLSILSLVSVVRLLCHLGLVCCVPVLICADPFVDLT